MKFLAIRIYSIYFWLVSFLWMGFLALTTVVLLPFVSYPKIHTLFLASGFSKIFELGFNRLNIQYEEGFDPKRKSVFCQNHVNLLDAHVAAAAIPHAFCGLMHAWQFKIPIYGWIMRMSSGIPVDPKSKDNLKSIIQEATKRRSNGYSILTFPEGGRTLDGSIRRFRKGVFRMAKNSGYPIVPIAVRGNYAINHKGSGLFTPFNTVDVWVGKQIETSQMDEKNIEYLAKKTEKLVRNFVEGKRSV